MRANDEETYRAFFGAEFSGTVRRIVVITGNRAAAEDASQEAFAKLYARWRKVSRYENPRAWVRKVATRTAIHALRRKTRTVEPQSEPTDLDRKLDVRAAVNSLSPRQRAAVMLHYYDDMSVADIADMIGCAPSTVKVHLHRARQVLAAALKEETHDVP